MGQLDNRVAGDTGEGQPRFGVLFDRHVGVDQDACANDARIIVIQTQFGDLANTDTAELHRTAARQAGYRLLEHHGVVVLFAAGAGAAQPDGEDNGGQRREDGEQADQHMIGSGFHGQAYSLAGVGC